MLIFSGLSIDDCCTTVGDFILRVFSTEPIVLEHVNGMMVESFTNEWKRHHDSDTTGGPLRQIGSDGHTKENPKWCQNPQYHVQVSELRRIRLLLQVLIVVMMAFLLSMFYKYNTPGLYIFPVYYTARG